MPPAPHTPGPSPSSPRHITLLTDFGTVDGYVAAMKGVLATLAPSAHLGGLLALVNSEGVVEIAVREGSAFERLGVQVGCPVALAVAGPAGSVPAPPGSG